NKVPIVEIREIDYQVPSFEEFAKTYQENEQTTRFYEDIFQAEVLQGPQYGPGNSQSQLGANTGVFGVVGKETHSGRTMGNNQVVNYIRFHLNRQLTYANGRFSRIDFIDRSPFNNIQVGDTLKIDLDKVSNRNCNYKFSACDVAERENVSLGNLTKEEEMAGKAAVGLVTIGANILCPEFGEFMADVGRVGGFGAEIYGNLSGDKEIEKLGEI
ncbi:3152_t:CDS:1, partial [Racocetra persica]